MINLSELKEKIVQLEKKIGIKITPEILEKYFGAKTTTEIFNMLDSEKNHIDLGDAWNNIPTLQEDAEEKNVDTNLKLRLKCLTANQLASIGVVNLVEGKLDEIVCPHCGNGQKDSKTGLKATFLNGGWNYHCFACDDKFDNLNLFAEHFNLDIERDFKEILRRADDLSKDISPINVPPITETKKEYPPDEIALIQNDIAESQLHVDEIPINDRRGLSLDTYRHFNCGYISHWKHYKAPTLPPTPRIIIPAGEKSYNAILVNSARSNVAKKYWKMNAGSKELFNADAILPNRPVIVTEGEIDAMSIWQATNGEVNVVALGGTSNSKKFLSYLNDKFNVDERINFQIIVMLDNDDAGRKAAAEFVDTLKAQGYPAIAKFFLVSTEKLDANDILTDECEENLQIIIAYIVEDALVELENIRKTAQIKLDDMREKTSANVEDSENVAESKDAAIPDDELERLKALPQSAERDEQIIAAINNKLYLTPQRKRAHMKWVADSLQENADLIFDNDPVIDGLVGYDEFYHLYTFLKPVFWRTGNCTGEQWDDSDDQELRRYLRKTYQNFKGAELIDGNLTHYSRKNSFHPIKKYLESLVWDGTPRAETYFSKFLNVDDTPYTREITRKWLLGAISRIYHEGCDFQFALVLHGKQGIGKGYSLHMLGSKWHISLKDSLDDAHAIDAIERGWIVEFEDWASGRKAEINAQKAFLSTSADTRRRAYARRATTTHRHCVFAISVNDEHFLRDVTGNRRFKIFECQSQPNEIVEGLTPEYVNQVWAEAFQMYQELFKDGFDAHLLRLSREVDAQADKIAEKHLQDDGLQGEIAAFLDTPILPNFIWNWLTKDERRKFFVDGRIALDKKDILTRIDTQTKRPTTRDTITQQFRDYYTENLDSGAILSEPSPKGVIEPKTYFYGTVTRNETCAAEVFNECFGNDKRKNTNRINEILSTLDGWARIKKHFKNFAGSYGDQKNAYYRNTPE